tara:strand:- start:1116 stop:1310 length:195 start_codon:yes stop_codon:yes gene_type:complete
MTFLIVLSTLSIVLSIIAIRTSIQLDARLFDQGFEDLEYIQDLEDQMEELRDDIEKINEQLKSN